MIFCNLPSQYCTLVNWEICTAYCPKDLYKGGLSDHTILLASLSLRAIGDKSAQPIPSEIFGNPLYPTYMEQTFWESKLHTLTGLDKLAEMKTLMRGAAEMVRDNMQQNDPDNPLIKSQCLSTIARVVWNQDWRLALAMIDRDTTAAAHIAVSGCTVSVTDADRFARECEEAHTNILNARAACISKSNLLGKHKLLKVNADNARLWIKHDKQLVLRGVILNEEVVRQEPQKTLALGEEWQKTFDEKVFEESEARAFLNELGDIGCYRNTPEPDIFTYYKVTNNRNKTAPGPDGLPYAAWQHKHAAPTLLEADIELRNGKPAPNGFNDSGCVFGAKGDDERDAVEVIRTAAKTRPLALKNCDNKMIMSANVKAVQPQYMSITHCAQNGFVPGRNFLHNVVDIDAAGRIYSTKYQGSSESIRNLVKTSL